MSHKMNRDLRLNNVVDENINNEESELETKDELSIEESNVEQEVVEEQDTPIPEKVRGIVRCIRLNVRKEPSLESSKIGVLLTGDELVIDLSKSTDCWYKVSTDSGLDGYCIKDFIEFKR